VILVAAFKGRAVIEIDLNTEGENAQENLPFDVRYNFYRIVQESLNNIVKHSEATRAEINLRQTDRAITLTIHDDGRGFDTQAIGAGMGMNSMRERAEAAGASFHVTSEPGRGTSVVIERPTL
jgi:two-component system, NarL family, sensor kinase